MTTNQRFAQYPSLENAPALITRGASGIDVSIVAHSSPQGARLAFIDLGKETA
jgi:hypothetical protein